MNCYIEESNQINDLKCLHLKYKLKASLICFVFKIDCILFNVHCAIRIAFYSDFSVCLLTSCIWIGLFLNSLCVTEINWTYVNHFDGDVKLKKKTKQIDLNEGFKRVYNLQIVCRKRLHVILHVIYKTYSKID